MTVLPVSKPVVFHSFFSLVVSRKDTLSRGRSAVSGVVTKPSFTRMPMEQRSAMEQRGAMEQETDLVTFFTAGLPT